MSRPIPDDERQRMGRHKRRFCPICQQFVTGNESTEYMTWGDLRQHPALYARVPLEMRNPVDGFWLVYHLAHILEVKS